MEIQIMPKLCSPICVALIVSVSAFRAAADEQVSELAAKVTEVCGRPLAATPKILVPR